MVEPRRVDLQQLRDKKSGSEAEEEEKESNFINKSNRTLLRKPSKKKVNFAEDGSGPPHLGRTRRQRSLNKHQTPLDRAKFQLLQVYGTWFAAHVAALDFKDIPGDEVESVVDGTLKLLYGMTADAVAEELRVIPDELIYKACLVLCGKFGRKKEGTELLKEMKRNGITASQKTYGAYTNALASSGANMLLSAAGSTSSGASVYSTHRRSFAPSAEMSSTKIRSMSAAGRVLDTSTVICTVSRNVKH